MAKTKMATQKAARLAAQPKTGVTNVGDTNLPLDLVAVGKEIVAWVEAGDRCEQQQEDRYKSAGTRLIQVRLAIKEPKYRKDFDNFKEFCDKGCAGMSRKHAYNLISLAEGRTTLAKLRMKAAAEMQKSRALAKQPKTQEQHIEWFKKFLETVVFHEWKKDTLTRAIVMLQHARLSSEGAKIGPNATGQLPGQQSPRMTPHAFAEKQAKKKR